MHRFAKSRLDARTLRERAAVSENPLEVDPERLSVVDRVTAVVKSAPPAVRIGLGVVTLLFILQLILR
jgi:hypothetical protein